MESLAHLKRLFAHDAWAGRETLESLRRPRAAPAEAVRLFAHNVATGFLWLARIRGEASPLPVWPELTLDESAARLDEITAAWSAYLEPLDEDALSHEIPYTNSKGERWTSTVEDILTHVSLHAHYHRGQIASRLRAAGFEPAYTDFVHWRRQGTG